MTENGFDHKSFLQTVPGRPGSYRMYSGTDEVIYVGKARDLKKRLSQYFLPDVSPKTRALMSHVRHIEFTVTFSEAEALLLENNLIKKYRPRYNILLRDDKSYPYLLLTRARHPALFYYRGARRIEGDYFGPYPDAAAARESLRLLQRLFPIRQCADSVYEHRSRPCLMAQLGKCLAPCVPMSESQEENYRRQVNYVRLFLKGQDRRVVRELAERMEQAAQALRFEEAAALRDQMLALRRTQESQSVSGDLMIDMDVIALAAGQGLCCVHVLFIRRGRVLGSRSYFPRLNGPAEENEALEAFLSQFYLSENRGGDLPREVILDRQLDTSVLGESLRLQLGREIRFVCSVRSERARYLRLARENARVALLSRAADRSTAEQRVRALEELLGLKELKRMECYDVSHTQGELTVASCVVFGREGPESSSYRRFNIDAVTPGDDFAAMRQVLERRFKNPGGEGTPDLIFIDGGKGQLKQAEEVLAGAFKAAEPPVIVAVAKGAGRREGLETLIRGFTREEFHLSLADAALQLVLHLRDEAHRFAITGHRGRRARARTRSGLESIPGVGPRRRQALLKCLGGRREVERASVEELSKVPGISPALAAAIYDALHGL